MTTFMKIEAVLYYLAKALGYLCGICGFLGVIGFVGGYDNELMTFGQFMVYELYAFGLCGLCYVLFCCSAKIEEDFEVRLNRIRRIVSCVVDGSNK